MPYLPIRPYISQGAKSETPNRVNLGPPHISETIRARKSKFYTHLDGPSAIFGHDNFSARGREGGRPRSLKLQCCATATFSSFFLSFFSFCHLNLWTRIGPSTACRYYKTSVAAGDAHKISTDIRPTVPPFFYRGTKCPKNLAKISTPIVFGPLYF